MLFAFVLEMCLCKTARSYSVSGQTARSLSCTISYPVHFAPYPFVHSMFPSFLLPRASRAGLVAAFACKLSRVDSALIEHLC